MSDHTITMEMPEGYVAEFDVPALWKLCEGKVASEVKPLDVICRINGFVKTFNNDDWERVKEADLNYPIIIHNKTGNIMDGCHRTVKAVVEGLVLKAIHIDELPDPIRVWKDWNTWETWRHNTKAD